MKRNVLLWLAAIVVAYFADTLFIVNESEQAIILQFGKPIGGSISTPGLKSKWIPFIRKVVFYDKRLLDMQTPSEELNLADQKRIVVESYAKFYIDKNNPLQFYQSLKTEEIARTRIADAIISSLRDVLGRSTLQEMLSSKRDAIMNDIKNETNSKLKNMGLTVIDVRIKKADLPEQTSQAIYSRMRSEREREAKEFRAQGQEMGQEIRAKADKEKVMLLTEADKKAQVIKGDGDKKAIKIWADAAKADKEFYGFYRSLEAYRKALISDNNYMVLSPEAEFFKYMKSIPK